MSKQRSFWFGGLVLLILVTVFLAGSSGFVFAQGGENPLLSLRNPYVSPPSSPLDTSNLPPASAASSHSDEAIIRPLRLLPRSQMTMEEKFQPHANVQSIEAPAVMPGTLTDWEGISYTGVLPPDTNGQVGPNHYIQMTNNSNGSQVRIWEKDGTLLYNFSMRDLWPQNDRCYIDAYGDPVVLYDQMADRWVLTQFALPNRGPYYECFAISKSGVPSDQPSDWYIYTFEVHQKKMNDYPKLGVWPDGYYMSVNQFLLGLQWAGAGVYVFEREKMLDGQAATFQYFDLEDVNDNYGGLLPSNLMGDTLPPSGAPNYFMSVDMNWSGSDDIMHIWEFHVDWDTTSNTTFNLVKEITVDPFDWNISEVPQPHTNQGLDALADRLMMHLWYRNYGDHESLVVNHTVDMGNDHAGIRWYEFWGGNVDTTLADAVIHQQGDYAPDAVHRWMGSVAMDRVGNMAMGFSVSNATNVYPGIRYTGRHYDDPAGQMPQGEGTIINGSGSQTSTSGRWGDYSSLTVDPTDDCTFWFTSEYMETTSEKNWQTRVGSFKFDNCCGGSESDVDGLKVEKSSANVVLSWDEARGVSEYKIYRSTNDAYFTPAPSNLLATVDSSTTSYTDNNATGSSSENYYYKVMAVDSCPPEAANYVERVGEFDFDLVPGSN